MQKQHLTALGTEGAMVTAGRTPGAGIGREVSVKLQEGVGATGGRMRVRGPHSGSGSGEIVQLASLGLYASADASNATKSNSHSVSLSPKLGSPRFSLLADAASSALTTTHNCLLGRVCGVSLHGHWAFAGQL